MKMNTEYYSYFTESSFANILICDDHDYGQTVFSLFLLTDFQSLLWLNAQIQDCIAVETQI